MTTPENITAAGRWTSGPLAGMDAELQGRRTGEQV